MNRAPESLIVEKSNGPGYLIMVSEGDTEGRDPVCVGEAVERSDALLFAASPDLLQAVMPLVRMADMLPAGVKGEREINVTVTAEVLFSARDAARRAKGGVND